MERATSRISISLVIAYLLVLVLSILRLENGDTVRLAVGILIFTGAAALIYKVIR